MPRKPIAEVDGSEAEELLSQIEEAERHCQKTSSRVESLRESLKEAKEEHKAAVAELRGLCRTRSEVNPLIDQAETPDAD